MIWPLLLACAAPAMPPLDVVEARVEDFGLGNFSVVAGFVKGEGDLVFEDVDGQAWRAPVRLWGPELGLSGGGGVPITSSLDELTGEPASAPLALPEVPFPAEQLLGRYRGLGAGAELVAGARVYWLWSREGVALRWVDLRLGAGFTASFEWLELELLESPAPEA